MGSSDENGIIPLILLRYLLPRRAFLAQRRYRPAVTQGLSRHHHISKLQHQLGC